MSQPTVIFLDLDGVLVDFVGGALAHHGRHIPPPDVRWGFPMQIGFASNHDPHFWAGMGRAFWAELKWTHEGRDLLLGLNRLAGDRIALMSSPCMTDGCMDGKMDWVRREAPAYARHTFLGAAKHLAAGPGKLLIDDHDDNVHLFRAHGGKALLVPRPWNERRAECDYAGRFDADAILAEAAGLSGGAS